VKLAQGQITGYRVHVVDHNLSRRLEFNTTNKQFLRLPELWSTGDYVNLAVEASSSVGYNDSLYLDVVHVHQSTSGSWLSLQYLLCQLADFSNSVVTVSLHTGVRHILQCNSEKFKKLILTHWLK